MKILKILSRIYVNNLERALPFYEELLQTEVGTKFHYEEKKLDIAAVGTLLIIGGTDGSLADVRDVSSSFLVDDIHAYKNWLLEHGAVIHQNIVKVPTGYNMIVQHPDGTLFEYVEHSLPTNNS